MDRSGARWELVISILDILARADRGRRINRLELPDRKMLRRLARKAALNQSPRLLPLLETEMRSSVKL
jgi:hypothetical protein